MTSKKHLFSIKEGIHYLNCAYKAPLLKSAEEAAMKALIQQRNPHEVKPKDFFTKGEQVMAKFAQLVGGQPNSIAIIPSVSYGMSMVFRNIKPKKGQHALTIQDAFPSNYFTIQRWCETHNTSFKVVEPVKAGNQIGNSWNELILNNITEDTAVVVIPHVHWMTGLKFDLAAIGERCRDVCAYLVVDGTQSVGALPMDVAQYKIDALICGSYKWLLGAYSVGLAYMSERFYEGIPLEESWMNRNNAVRFSELTNYDPTYKPGAERYNVGQTSHFILMSMVNAALDQLLEWGIDNIQAYCKELTLPLMAYLDKLGVTLEETEFRAAHLFALRLPAQVDADLLKSNLVKNNIFLSVRGSALRVAVNVFNTEEDIATLIETIRDSIVEK